MSYHLLLDAALPTEELEKALLFLIPMLIAAAAAALVIVLAVRKKKKAKLQNEQENGSE